MRDGRARRRPVDLGARAARRRLGVAVPGRARLGDDPRAGGREPRALPILRDLDGYLYVRHYRGRFLVGAFEPKGKPNAPGDIDTGGFVEFGEDWDHFAPVLDNARERLPELTATSASSTTCARPESFTPDSNFHLGEFPEVPGLFVAAGFNSQGIIYAPGAGKALAEWIVEGHPTMDLTEVDIARTGRWANDRAWLHEKTRETLGRLYAMHWPALQPDRPGAASAARRWTIGSRPPAPRSARRRAGSGPRGSSPARRTSRSGATTSTGRRGSSRSPRRCVAAREGVALFDLSTYSKFLVQGPGALSGLQRLCASDVDVPVGRVVYTLLCNDRGGIEMDPTVTRLAEQIGSWWSRRPLYQRRTEGLLRAGFRRRDRHRRDERVRRAAPGGADARGSCSQRLTDADLSDEAFPFLSAHEDRSRMGATRGRFGCPTPASSGGSCTCRRSSRATCTTRVVEAGRGSRSSPRRRVRVRRAPSGARVPLVGARHGAARRSVRGGAGVRGSVWQATSSGARRSRERKDAVRAIAGWCR